MRKLDIERRLEECRIEIEYNPKAYDSIIGTGRFNPLDFNFLEPITSFTECTHFPTVSEAFHFTYKGTRFPVEELSKILQVHAPTEANAYYFNIKDNILHLIFLRKKE